jgi:eukaryotic-like serine/threonine-protein kinase
MQLTCPHCNRRLEFANERPSFCAFCGQRLNDDPPVVTQEYNPEAATLIPTVAKDNCEVPGMPTSIGGYRLVRPIGSGGMGAVYEGEDIASGRKVALKLISPEFATSTETVERFRQEGRLASMIAHPRCVFVLAADEEAGRPYIVMELMSGSTLHELVQQAGPLPPEEAVAKVLDVIDGLQEAHRLGVIHRDVKPSNCFLEPDGRVKIGDFGLSKSLVQDLRLTRTGAFMGTPLYASPEQIRADRVNEQTDVYSVAATLYFLLTGKAPFETGDAAATLARIVSDAAPSMRTLRPEIPTSLDRIVLRGLEKDRKKRWSDLEQFGKALAVFLPTQVSIGSLGLRITAFVGDWFVLSLPFTLLVATLVGPITSFLVDFIVDVTWTLSFLLYFGILEGLWGCSPGKWFFRLQACKFRTRECPGFRHALQRAVVFYAAVFLPSSIVDLIDKGLGGEGDTWLGYILVGVGLVASAATMRKGNGYRGVHEMLSATRVVRLPWPRPSRKLQLPPSPSKVLHSGGLPKRLGSFEVQGVLWSVGEDRILLGQDLILERSAWIWLRPLSQPSIAPARREISRTTRPRWLSCGKWEDWQWDAFLAPAGCPLPSLVKAGGRLPWADAHVMLEQLADELAFSCKDDCLPRPLTVDKVWVESSGKVQLVDVSLSNGGKLISQVAGSSLQQEAFELLGKVAAITLEGQLRAGDPQPTPLRAPLPQFARTILDKLFLGLPRPYTDVKEIQRDLVAVGEKPQEVTSSQRGTHLSLLSTIISVPVLIMFLFPSVTLVLIKSFLMFGISLEIRESEKIKCQLEENSVQDSLSLILSTDPVSRAWQAHAVSTEQQSIKRMENWVEKFRTEQSRLKQSAGWAVRGEAKVWAQVPDVIFIRNISPDLRSDLGAVLSAPTVHGVPSVEELSSADFSTLFMRIAVGSTVSWLLIWSIWAIIWRGGISLRLAGLTLLRANGRKAMRIQCAWRAFLVWAPVTGLLLLSSWLDLIVCVHWVQGTSEEARWAFWLSWISWGTALILMPTYFALALRNPTRSLPDRLAGTYLMPR